MVGLANYHLWIRNEVRICHQEHIDAVTTRNRTRNCVSTWKHIPVLNVGRDWQVQAEGFIEDDGVSPATLPIFLD